MEEKDQAGDGAETGGKICQHQFFMVFENFAQHGVDGQVEESAAGVRPCQRQPEPFGIRVSERNLNKTRHQQSAEDGGGIRHASHRADSIFPRGKSAPAKTSRQRAQREALREILRQHPHPLTNKEILAALPAGQCDLATIYRAMHLLEAMGMVKRFDFGDGDGAV